MGIWGTGESMFVGILPASWEYGMKSMSLKKPSVDAEENIFNQTGAHLVEAPAAAV